MTHFALTNHSRLFLHWSNPVSTEWNIPAYPRHILISPNGCNVISEADMMYFLYVFSSWADRSTGGSVSPHTAILRSIKSS